MKLTIIGDVLLDRDVDGVADRLCPDAPVAVVDERTSLERPGGAGLAAILARRNDVDVTLVTAIADDAGGRTLQGLLAESGVELIGVDDGGATSEKTRIMVGGRPMLRLDRGGPGPLGPVPPGVAGALRQTDAVLVADYGRGLLEVDELRRMVAEAPVAVVWDPHPRGAQPPPGVTLVTPNRHELDHFEQPICEDARYGATGVDRVGTISARAEALRARWQAESLVVTLGSMGALLVAPTGSPFVVPVDGAPGTGDACGAGDAFAVAAATALAKSNDVRGAVVDAVDRASTFVADGGVRHLLSLRPSTCPSAPDADPLERARAVQAAKGTVVATGGCFDVLHAGHVATLQSARSLGQHLVVLLNSDASVRRLKGEGRPLQSAPDRAAVLRSLGCVDDVIVFDDDTPVQTLRELRPDIFVKGGDYAGTTIAESAVLASWGGTVVTVPFAPGRSSTAIIDRAAAAAMQTAPVPEVGGVR